MITIENVYDNPQLYPEDMENSIEAAFHDLNLNYNKLVDHKTNNVTYKIIK